VLGGWPAQGHRQRTAALTARLARNIRYSRARRGRKRKFSPACTFTRQRAGPARLRKERIAPRFVGEDALRALPWPWPPFHKASASKIVCAQTCRKLRTGFAEQFPTIPPGHRRDQLRLSWLKDNKSDSGRRGKLDEKKNGWAARGHCSPAWTRPVEEGKNAKPDFPNPHRTSTLPI